MASRSNKETNNYYAITRGRMSGLFKHWSLAQPLVDKYSGAAYQGFNDLNKAINFMIMGGFSLNGIKMHEDKDNVDIGEPVTDFATKNGITITAGMATNEQTDDFDSDTEGKVHRCHRCCK